LSVAGLAKIPPAEKFGDHILRDKNKRRWTRVKVRESLNSLS